MADITKKGIPEMQKEVTDLREALRTLRFAAEGSRSRNVKEAKTKRREIARLLTEMNSRKVAK